MAFDHNKDLTAVNLPYSDDSRIGTPTTISIGIDMAPQPQPCTTTGRVSDGFYSNHTSPMLLHYPDPASGLGFPNPHPAWPPIPHLTTNTITPSDFRSRPTANGISADQPSEDGAADSVSGKKVKFLCSFGGKILPRPSDGMLRYVGGHTRIISVTRDVSFPDLLQKMTDTYGQSVVIKYQLPDEDLDALVSVSCPDDLDNMMEEYDKLLEQSGDGSAKLRVFLFSASDLDSSGSVHLGDFHDTGHRYVDAVNGFLEGIGGPITRKESIASAASTQNSDISAPDNVDALVSQDITGPPSTTLFDSSTSNDNVAPSQTSAPPFTLSPPPPPVATFSQPEIELERTIPFQALLQQQPPRYNFQQTGSKFPPPPAPYLGGFVDPHHDASGHTDYQKLPPQMVYTNTQMMGAGRPILVQPQYRDNSPTLLTQQFVPAVHRTMAPTSSHLSVNPNIVQPLAHKVVAVPADQSYNQAYPPQTTRGFGWNQLTPPQDHGAFLEGWMAQQQGIPRTADCYMCQKALPHAHSDTVVQDQRDGHSPSATTNANSLYHSLQVDDISRLSVMSPQNQGVTGLVGDVQMPCGVPRGNLPATLPDDTTQQQHLVSPSRMKQVVLVSKPVSGENTYVGGVSYQMSEQFVHDTSKEYSGPIHGVTLAEDVARPSVPNMRPVDLKKENIQTNPTDLLLSNEQGRLLVDQHKNNDTSEQARAQNLGKETVPNIAKPSETLPCSTAEAPFKYNIQAVESVEVVQQQAVDYIGSRLHENVGISYVDDKPSFPAGDSTHISDIISPGNDMRDDTTRFQVIPSSALEASPQNCGGITNDSPCSLFSNQDPWDMRRDAPFPPPKPSKIATKRDAFVMRDVQGHGEYSMEAHLMEGVRETLDQFQTGKDMSEEQIKQQLQATAEEVAASVVDSSLSSNLDFSSPNIDASVSVASHEMGGQTNSDDVIQNKMEAMNLKPEKTNFGFPLSDGIGRLQIIKNSDLEELRELGSGTFGTVYHGKWRGTDVAIKRINDRCFTGKPSEQERMRDDFWNEAIKLADLHHPNVVAFYGVVLDGPGGSVATVTEYMVNGSLRTALQKNERNLDKRKRILILMDVAFGMEYLHSKNIVHFDLKSDNLLVNLRDPHRPICKVGDLGLSKVKCQTLISGGVRGTLPWMAPELLNGSSSLVSDKVDVFSFGIVMWELLTGEEPYADLHYGAIIGGIVSNTLRPQVPENCDPEWKSLMERCWSAEPSERPKFTEIANELRSMAAKVPLKGQGQTPTNIKRHDCFQG